MSHTVLVLSCAFLLALGVSFALHRSDAADHRYGPLDPLIDGWPLGLTALDFLLALAVTGRPWLSLILVRRFQPAVGRQPPQTGLFSRTRGPARPDPGRAGGQISAFLHAVFVSAAGAGGGAGGPGRTRRAVARGNAPGDAVAPGRGRALPGNGRGRGGGLALAGRTTGATRGLGPARALPAEP